MQRSVVMQRSWYFVIILSVLVSLGGSVGIKRRIAEADAAAAAASSTSVHQAVAPSIARKPPSIKRRIADADVAESHASSSMDPLSQKPTKYFNRLKRDWAKGKMSSKDVQGHACDAMESGAGGVHRMAKMGNWGQNPKNMARALVDALGMSKDAPPIEWFEIPTNKGARSPHPSLLPHQLFKAMHDNDRQR